MRGRDPERYCEHEWTRNRPQDGEIPRNLVVAKEMGGSETATIKAFP